MGRLLKQIGLELVAKSASFVAGMKAASTATKKLDKGINILGLSMANSMVFNPIKQRAFGAVKALAGLVSVSGDFENALTELGIVTGVSDGMLDNMGNSIKRLTATLPVTNLQLLDTAAVVSRLGLFSDVSKDKLGDFNGTMLQTISILRKTGRALNIPQEKVTVFADEFARVAASFSNSNEEARDLIPHLANMVLFLGNNLPESGRQLVKSLTRSGDVAKSFGLDAAEAGALVSTAYAAGLRELTAGTQANSILINLFKDDSAKALIEGMGITEDQIKNVGNESGFLILAKLADRANELGGPELIHGLFAKIGTTTQRAVPALLRITRAWEDLAMKAAIGSRLLKGEVIPGIESMDEAYFRFLGTLNTSIEIYDGIIDTLKNEFGDSILKSVTGLVKSLNTLLAATVEWAQANKPTVKQLVLFAVKAAVVLSVVTSLAAALVSLAVGVKLFKFIKPVLAGMGASVGEGLLSSIRTLALFIGTAGSKAGAFFGLLKTGLAAAGKVFLKFIAIPMLIIDVFSVLARALFKVFGPEGQGELSGFSLLFKGIIFLARGVALIIKGIATTIAGIVGYAIDIASIAGKVLTGKWDFSNFESVGNAAFKIGVADIISDGKDLFGSDEKKIDKAIEGNTGRAADAAEESNTLTRALISTLVDTGPVVVQGRAPQVVMRNKPEPNSTPDRIYKTAVRPLLWAVPLSVASY